VNGARNPDLVVSLQEKPKLTYPKSAFLCADLRLIFWLNAEC